MATIKLSKLIYHLYDATLYSDVEVSGLALDSRKVKPGDLFFACKGTQLNGSDFIESAIEKGAVAVLEETDKKNISVHKHQGVPIFPVSDLSQRIGKIAADFYDHPARKLKIIGVTGTNGKTSCTFLLAESLHHAGLSCGIIGTLGTGIFGKMTEGNLTTPDAITLQSIFADFVKKKIKYVAMEVSSHSIDQGRVNGVEFEIGIFTNLTRDHLDYHGSMEAYGETKKKLFAYPTTHYAIINADDAFGFSMLESLPREDIFAYSLQGNDFPPGLEVSKRIYATNIQYHSSGMTAKAMTPWGNREISIPLVGEFNLSNALAVLATLNLLQIPFDTSTQVLSQLTPVPGRMQLLGGKDQPLVVVDYAHTPDALEKVLIALRTQCPGKLHCLFGCGGNRDTGKRPLMAQIAEKYADIIMVTDDNPRMEDPQKIITDIMQGFTHPEKVKIEHNRSKAIKDIIQYAQINDCVLIAGKGAEAYQQIGQEKIPFSDVEKVMESLHARLVE